MILLWLPPLYRAERQVRSEQERPWRALNINGTLTGFGCIGAVHWLGFMIRAIHWLIVGGT